MDGLTKWEREAEWFGKNIKQAKAEDIGPSDVPCPNCNGVFMEQYNGKEFVDWTHRCPKCGVMYGCA
jgi:ribosomal protein S27AE